MTDATNSPTISFKGKNTRFEAKRQIEESEKNITLPVNLEIAWQGYKSYIPELERLLSRKLSYLNKLYERDIFELPEKEVLRMQHLQNEVDVLYRIYNAMTHTREMIATELGKKIDSYEVEINYLRRGWKNCGDVLKATHSELLNLKNQYGL